MHEQLEASSTAGQSGGVNVHGGTVNTAGGDFIGRDKIIYNQDPTLILALTEAFAEKLGASNEKRIGAEAKAAEIATKLNFTTEAVIGFFQILGREAVPIEQLQPKLAEIAAHYQQAKGRLAAIRISAFHASQHASTMAS